MSKSVECRVPEEDCYHYYEEVWEILEGKAEWEIDSKRERKGTS